jgi:nicotinate phosphoribosyltransferase
VAEPERAHRWTGLRQDSGDPFLFGPRVKEMYKSIGIDHDSKILVYSDALTIDKCLKIKRQCEELGFSKGGFLLLVVLVFGCRSYWTLSYFWNRNVSDE